MYLVIEQDTDILEFCFTRLFNTREKAINFCENNGFVNFEKKFCVGNKDIIQSDRNFGSKICFIISVLDNEISY